MVMWHDVTEDAAEQFRSLLHMRGAYLEDCYLCLDLKNSVLVTCDASDAVLSPTLARYWRLFFPISHGQNSRPSATTSSSAQDSNIQIAPVNPISTTSTTPSNSSSLQSTQPSNNTAFIGSQQANQSSISVATSPQGYVLYGVAASRPSLELAHLKTTLLGNDGELFARLRGDYRQFQGSLRYWFSIWYLSHCDFVKVFCTL